MRTRNLVKTAMITRVWRKRKRNKEKEGIKTIEGQREMECITRMQFRESKREKRVKKRNKNCSEEEGRRSSLYN